MSSGYAACPVQTGASPILAYRIGALRLAIVGTWTAVAYDIIEKIRELASTQADAQAVAFISDFERNVEANNVSKLLDIERKLIKTASDGFGFPRPLDAQFLERLRDDRHLCAHPAFSHDNELFRPSPDVVRAHIVQSVEVLLALPPLSGKALIDSFVADVSSNAFPRDRARTIVYVRERFLNRMRPRVKSNLAVVLIKELISRDIPELLDRTISLLDSLHAIRNDDPQMFNSELIPLAADLLERTDEDGLLNGISLLREFPEINAALPANVLIRLTALASSSTPNKLIFFAFGVISADIDAALLERFAASDPGDMAAVLLIVQDARFVPYVIQSVKDSRSFRSAETRLANALQLLLVMTPADLAALIGAADNPQVHDAAQTPELLLRIARTVGPDKVKEVDWDHFRAKVWYHDRYLQLWTWLRDNAIYDAPTGPPDQDDD